MDRRACLVGCTALVAARQGAWGQATPRVIAVLNASSAEGMRRDLTDALREGLAAHGWVEGRHIELQFRFADGQHDRLPALLDELLRLRPALLVAAGPRPAMVARDAKVSLPVVAAAVDDPVALGIAREHALPGGNFTGVSAAFDGILSRRLQLLADLVPEPRRLAILGNPLTNPLSSIREELPRLEAQLGSKLHLLEASAPADFDGAFTAMARERVNGLLVLADAALFRHRHDLGARCMAMRLPSVWGGRGYLDAPGVASYQGDFRAVYVRAAALVDKILRGTPPGQIPFEQGTKFELVIHAGVAKALGLTIPQRVRVAADEVIE